MSEFVASLRDRIEKTEIKLRDVTGQLRQLAVEHEALTGDLKGYKRALAAETRGREPIQGLTADGVGDSKAEFARQFIRARGGIGATPADLFEGFQERGIHITKPYIYSLVQRLRQQGAIEQKQDKWFPVASANGSGAGQ